MDPNLFVTMGRELRQLKEMHKDDWELNQIADLMIMQMRNYPKAPNDEARGVIEKSFSANMAWLVEWKRSKLVVVKPSFPDEPSEVTVRRWRDEDWPS